MPENNGGRFRGWTEANVKVLLGAVKRIEEKIDIQNNRVSKLENWRSWLVGAFAGAGLLVGYIVAAVAG